MALRAILPNYEPQKVHWSAGPRDPRVAMETLGIVELAGLAAAVIATAAVVATRNAHRRRRDQRESELSRLRNW